MKAVDYFNQYGEMIFEEAVKGQHATMLVMFSEVYNEIETLCKTRNAVKDSAKVSAVKEVNQKWNKIRDLFIKKYTASPIKKDAIRKIFLKENPSFEGMFTVEKSPKKFEPSDAQKEFEPSMHPSSIVAENLFGDDYTARFDDRNRDNIVAKRGALFMINLKHEVESRGFMVAHIKTDSIKVPDATEEIIKFICEYGRQYGYNFVHAFEGMFTVEKSPKKFEPADAQKEFDKMSSSMRLMNSLDMLGIMARQKTRETGGEPYEN